MYIEIIKSLKERAKEMLEDNYDRKIGDEEIYTIICELENFYTAYEKEKEKNETQPDCAEPVERTEEMVNMKWVNYRYINKEKLKEILGIEENLSEERILSLLETIVSENSRLEDIEDRKVQIEYNNVFNKGVKSVKDKIKAKIEPVLKQLERKMEEEYNKYGNSREYQDIVDAYNFLQSLLEKE